MDFEHNSSRMDLGVQQKQSGHRRYCHVFHNTVNPAGYLYAQIIRWLKATKFTELLKGIVGNVKVRTTK